MLSSNSPDLVSAFLLTLTASAFWNGKTLRKTTTWMTETTDACFKAKRLRDQALRLVRSEGRASGNIEVRGQQRRIVEYERGRLSIKYVLPRYPDAPAIRTARPTAFTILVRFDGLKVLNIAWDDARTAVLILKPGIWERWLAA